MLLQAWPTSLFCFAAINRQDGIGKFLGDFGSRSTPSIPAGVEVGLVLVAKLCFPHSTHPSMAFWIISRIKSFNPQLKQYLRSMLRRFPFPMISVSSSKIDEMFSRSTFSWALHKSLCDARQLSDCGKNNGNFWNSGNFENGKIVGKSEIVEKFWI